MSREREVDLSVRFNRAIVAHFVGEPDCSVNEIVAAAMAVITCYVGAIPDPAARSEYIERVVSSLRQRPVGEDRRRVRDGESM